MAHVPKEVPPKTVHPEEVHPEEVPPKKGHRGSSKTKEERKMSAKHHIHRKVKTNPDAADVKQKVPPAEVPPAEVPPVEVHPLGVPPKEVRHKKGRRKSRVTKKDLINLNVKTNPDTADVNKEVPPAEVPPAEVPPVKVPLAEVPPAEVPPVEVPPVKVPLAEVSSAVGGQDSIVTKERIQNAKNHIRFPSCRFVFVAMGFWGFIVLYSLRVNMSIAIVAMTNSTYMRLHSAKTNISQEDTCARNRTATKDKYPGTYSFTAKDQNLIASSFFWGYLIFPVAAGTLAQKFGGKVILLSFMFIASVLTMLFPVLGQIGGLPGLVTARVLTGFAEGTSYPAMHVLISRWGPPQEKSRMVSFIYAGSKLGIVLTSPLAGFLADTLGWESIFYVTGTIGALWCLLCIFLIYDSPRDHPRISPAEYEYIMISQGEEPAKASLRVPWLAIIKSPPVYALMLAHFVYNWGNFTLLSSLPQYMKYILDFDIKSNGLVSGIPYFLMWFFMLVTGVTCDFLMSHNIMSVTKIRKLMMSTSFIGSGTFLIATGFTCNRYLAVTLVTISIGFSGISWGGWSVNHLDLAPPYAGTLMGITNGFSTIAGITGPNVVGALNARGHSLTSWRIFFYISGGMYIFGTIVYMTFGSGERQKWGYEPSQLLPADATNTETAKAQLLKTDATNTERARTPELDARAITPELDATNTETARKSQISK